jgi:hypothetical protein
MLKTKKESILAIVIVIALTLAFTACENPIMIELLKPLGVPEKGEENGDNPVEITGWWTWVANQDNNTNKYVSTAQIRITPHPNNTGCDVDVTRTANGAGYVWAVQAGCNYTATAGKTYKATWKWKAAGKAFRNVTIRYAWYDGYDTDELYLGTNVNKLTIPVTEETRAYYFTIPRNGKTNFSFMAGADTGSFTISDFKIEKVEPIKIEMKDNTGELNGNPFHNYQELYDIPLSEIGGRITSASIYTFTYSFKSNVAITGDLEVFIVDNSQTATPQYWKELSDNKIISVNISAKTEVSGIITLIATTAASSTAAEANRLGFRIGSVNDATGKPTLTFTTFSFNKGAGTTIITLGQNTDKDHIPPNWDQWQGYYNIPTSVRGNGIKTGDKFKFNYSFTSNIAITGKLEILLADTSNNNLKELSIIEPVYTGISANDEVSGTKTFTATRAASSSDDWANMLIFRVDPASGAASEPTLTFKTFEFEKTK